MILKKLRGIVSDALNSLDKFEEPVQLNLKGGSTSTTTIGGAISLIIMAFLAYQFLYQTIGMFDRDSQQVVQMNEFENDPSSVVLSRENNFFMSLSSRLGNNFVDMTNRSLISFKGFFYQQRLTSKGPEIINAGQVIWTPCQRSDIPKVLPESTYDTYFLAAAYCASAINFTNPMTGACPASIQSDYPDCITPPEFNIEGTMFSQIFEFIDLFVTLCDPNDASSIIGLTCSPTALNETLAAEGISVYLGYTNTYIDPTNYTTPNQTFADFLDWNLHPQLSRTASLFFDLETVEDYDSYIFTNKSTKHTFYSISADKMREQQLTSRKNLLEVSIQRSKVNKYTTRTYVKIFDVLSNVGGLSGTLFLIGGIFALGYARYKAYMVLSNDLYDFEKYQKTISVKKVALDAVKNTASDKNNLPNSARKSALLNSSREQGKIDIKEYFDSLKAKKKLEFNELTYLKGLVARLFRKKDPNEELAQKAIKKLNKDLDVSNIIEKLKEIDKLKMILLNPSQLEAFNFIKKPVITLRRNNNKDGRDSTKPSILLDSIMVIGSNSPKNIKQLTKFEKLYAAYKEMKEDRNAENIKFNKRLISMMDEEILNVFKQIENQKSIRETQQFDQLVQEIQEKYVNIDVVGH